MAKTAKSKTAKTKVSTTKPKANKSASKATTKKTTSRTKAVEKGKSSKSASEIVRQPVATSAQPPEPTQRLTKTYLTKEELKHFEEILLQKRAEVMRDLEIMRAASQEDSEPNPSYSTHLADHGTETLDHEQRFMFIQRDERYLSYINKALERIKNGTYGICVKSGLPIPKERLEAVPHTAVRIEYKNR